MPQQSSLRHHAVASMAAEHDASSLERLKRAAEAEMRRSAPPLSKKQKLDAGCQQQEDGQQQQQHSRYSYVAPDALVQGAACFLATCNFKREKSATLELQDILHQVLPGVKLQLVRVDCNGLVVVVASRPAAEQPAAQQPSAAQKDQQPPPAAAHDQQQQPPPAAAGDQQQQQEPLEAQDQQQTSEAHEQQQLQQQPSGAQQQQPQALLQPTAVVEDILQRIEAGSLPRTKFIQRIVPADTTCLLTAAALRPALQLAVSRFVDSSSSSSSSPLTYAVAFKARGSNNISGKKLAAAGGTEAATPSAVDRRLATDLAAAVVQECCSNRGGARADLSSPQVAIVLEVVPVAGQQLVCSVAALPGAMMITKPRLVIKPSGA